MNNIKLAICIHDITTLGGVEKVTYNFYKKIKTTLYNDTRLLSLYASCPNKYGDDVDFLYEIGTPVINNSFSRKLIDYFLRNNINSLIIEIIDLKEAIVLANLAKKIDINVFFVLHNTPKMYLRNFATIYDCVQSPKQFLRKIYKFLIGSPVNYFRLKTILSLGRIITVGHNCETELINLFPKYKNRVSAIYNLTDLSKTKAKNHHSNNILYMGRFELQKDLNLLLRVWKNFIKLNKNYALHIIGDGSEKEHIKKFIKRNKLCNIKIFDRVNNVADYYSNCDVCILTSHYEGLPTVFIEALSQNCYIFAVKSFGGTGELIENNKNGFYVNSRKAKTIARQLDSFVNSMIFPIVTCSLPLEFNDEIIMQKWKSLIERY